MNALIERLGWMLLHSLWEGAAVWLLLQVALIVLQKKSAQARYLAACFALAAMALLPWMTFGSLDLSARLRSAPIGSVPALVHSEDAASPSAVALSSDVAPSLRSAGSLETFLLPAPRTDFVNAFLPWLVGGWGLGVAVFAFRLWISWRSVRRLARLPLSPLSAAWRQRLAELCRTAGVRSVVRAGETAAVVVPLVVGWLKPVILLPLGVLAQLPAGQVEAVLLHELAHIRRHDFLVNLLQSVVETLFFYHPAVRSISRRIREERERVCDDLSVEWCRNPVVYAEALTTFEEFRRQSLALAVTDGDLLARVRRVVLGVEPRQNTASLFAAAGFLATGVYLASMFLAPLLASELMTDKERVAAIEALHPPGAETMSDDKPAPQVPLSGTLRTEDNQPLPRSLAASGRDPQTPPEAAVLSHYANGTMGGFLNFEGNSFYGNPGSGNVCLAIWAEGYAPLLLDHLEIKNQKIGPLSLVLRRGFPACMRILAPDGKPLPGVKLSASTRAMTRYPTVGMPGVETNGDGQATLGNLQADTVLTVSAAKGGWQTTESIFGDWSPDHVVSWTLYPAVLTSGIILDRTTHRPVPDATISLASQNGPDPSGPQNYDPTNAPILGHGDEHGNFKLDTLNSSYTYNIYVKAPGYPLTVFPIQPGDHDNRLALSSGLRVSGRILDPKGLLKKAYPPVQIRCEVSISPSAQNLTDYSLFQTFTQLGPVIPFSFRDLPSDSLVFPGLPANQVEFLVNGNWYKLQLTHDVDNFVIDLGKPPPSDDREAPLQTRPVKITLVAGKDSPAPGGDLNIKYDFYGDTPKVQNFLVQKSIVLKNGEAAGSFPVPNRLYVNPNGLIGYWFKEQSFELPAGAAPVIKTIEVIPAGAIHGRVTGESNLRDKLFTSSPILIKAAPGLEGTNVGGNYVPAEGSDRYVTGPLPFGGVYSVVLQQGMSSYTVSPPIRIDAAHPVVDCDLHEVAEGILRGKFIDANQRPIGFESVFLTYVPNEHCSFSTLAARTAVDGTFTISNLNFNVPGYYQIQLDDPKWMENSVHIDGRTPQPMVISAKHRGK
jgi:beta-lactamase regulating signal transducer with metallopeptidase domain